MLKTAHLRCLVHPLAVFWWAIRSDGWKQRLYQRWGLERGQSKGAKRGQKMMFSFLVLSDFEHLYHYWQITEKIVVVAVASSLTSMIRGRKFEDLLWNIPDWLSADWTPESSGNFCQACCMSWLVNVLCANSGSRHFELGAVPPRDFQRESPPSPGVQSVDSPRDCILWCADHRSAFFNQMGLVEVEHHLLSEVGWFLVI